MLAEYLGGEQLLVGQVPRGVLVDAVVVAVLGLHLVRRHQHRLLRRAVDVLGQDVAANLGNSNVTIHLAFDTKLIKYV